MMIEHHHVEAEPAGLGQRLETGRAAIDRDQKRCALARQHADRFAVGTVALGEAVGNMNARARAVSGQKPCQQCGGTGAVDIVIAEDGDALALLDRERQPGARALHVAQCIGVGQPVADARIEEARHIVEGNPPPRDDPGKHLLQAMALRDHRGAALSLAVKAIAPAPAIGRGGDGAERIDAGIRHPPL